MENNIDYAIVAARWIARHRKERDLRLTIHRQLRDLRRAMHQEATSNGK